MVPVLYGLPTEEAWEGVASGGFVLGGCVLDGNDPTSRCIGCGYGSELSDDEAGEQDAGEQPDAESEDEGKARRRVWKLLQKDLGAAAVTTGRGTWSTTSGLPHEIRVQTQAGRQFVRVSAGMVTDVRATKAFLNEINDLNILRGLSRRILVDGTVLVVAEMPVASLRKGDLEELISMVLCCARLDAPLLAAHGGTSVTSPPPSAAIDFGGIVESWDDLLRMSGTATKRELTVWLDDLAGSDCWIDNTNQEAVVVVHGAHGRGATYPFALHELVSLAAEPEAESLGGRTAGRKIRRRRR